jgi:hypothetical protein
VWPQYGTEHTVLCPKFLNPRTHIRKYKLLKYNKIGIKCIDMIYLSTAIGLTPGGSSTVHIYTQTVHRTTQITTNLEECWPCPVFASFTLAFALQLRKKCGETSVGVAEECKYTYYQNTHALQNLRARAHTHTHTHTYTHTPTHYKTHSHTNTHTHTHITKQHKTTTVQIKANTVQDVPK